MGFPIQLNMKKGKLDSAILRKSADRKAFRPVHIENGKITPLEYHGSSHINALSNANGLIQLGKGVKQIEKDSIVSVQLFSSMCS